MNGQLKDIRTCYGSITLDYGYSYGEDGPLMCDTNRPASGRIYVVGKWNREDICSKTLYFKHKYNAQAYIFEETRGF